MIFRGIFWAFVIAAPLWIAMLAVAKGVIYAEACGRAGAEVCATELP